MSMTKEAALAVPLFIKERRKKKNMSQETLATKVGVSTATISNLETGRNGFTDKTLAAIAEALNCSPVDLLRPMNDDGRVSGEAAISNLLERADIIPPGEGHRAYRVLMSVFGEDDEKS